MKKQSSGGFALVELLVVVILVLVVGGFGYYVYQNQNKSEPPVSQAPADVEAKDSTQTFSYSYSADWQLKPYDWVNCCSGPEETEPDWTVTSQPIVLMPSSIQPSDTYEHEDTAVTVSYKNKSEYFGRENLPDNYDDIINVVKDDYNTFEKVTINGHDALYNLTEYLGPPDAKVESFTDHRYYFFEGDMILEVYFREKYHHDWNPENDLDNSQYKDEYDSIAHSIVFL